MIVVDGRTDREKLVELLRVGGECTELDFKERVDLGDAEQKLNFVKDAISMYNRYPGGYLVVGATDEGEPSEICGDMDWGQLDGAKLADLVSKYVDVTLCPISALHELDGHAYRLICFKSPEDAPLIPFSKLGQYKNPKTGRQEVVFRPGDIIRRDGAQNRPIEDSQWGEILRRHDEIVREDESKRINLLVDRLTAALEGRGKTPPLVPGMDDASLARTLAACFENGETAGLERFVVRLSSSGSPSKGDLVGLTAMASYSLLYKMDDLFKSSLDALYGIYAGIDEAPGGTALDKTDIAVAIYEIGAMATALGRWGKILPLVGRRSPAKGNIFFASWLRDCQVHFSNSDRSDDKGASQLISLALLHIKGHPVVMPILDLQDQDSVERAGADGFEDLILNSLCSFDFLYNVCMFATSESNEVILCQSYPACIGFSEDRIRAAMMTVFGDYEEPRRMLLPGLSDSEIARAVKSAYTFAAKQSEHSGRLLWGLGLSSTIGRFLGAHGDRPREREELGQKG